MNDLINVLDQKLIPIIHDGKPVLTFRQIDLLHKRPEGTARKRFADNRKYFIDGEDYYILQKAEIIALSEKRTDINSEAPKLALVTETGYLSLVKSFTDDLAWKVQKVLVNTYFRNKNNDPSQMTKLDWIEIARQQEIEKLALEQKIKEDQPKVEFAESITHSEDAIEVGEFAKILCKRDIDIGPNRLFKMMKNELKLLITSNKPMQYALDNKWLEVDPYVYEDNSGKERRYNKVRITGKGQQYIEKKVREVIATRKARDNFFANHVPTKED